jgi:hypothetical protein
MICSKHKEEMSLFDFGDCTECELDRLARIDKEYEDGANL